jgi:hypothetical protein
MASAIRARVLEPQNLLQAVGQEFMAEALAGDIMHQCRRSAGLAHFGFISTPTRGVSPHMYTSVTPDGECKSWLAPSVGLARNNGVPAHDLRRIEKLVFEHPIILRAAFHEYHRR